MIKILVAEDDKDLRNIIARVLKQNNYEVHEAKDGEEALQLFYKIPFDLVLLDIMMPKLDGLKVLKEIREFKETPTIMLTARNTEYDEIEGFKNGADEYITKPFSNQILLSRIEALLKRCTKKINKEVKEGTLRISFREHTVYEDEKRVSLTPKEFDLLCYLIENKNISLTRQKILECVWGFDYEGDERTVDTHVKCIRLKLNSIQGKLRTIRKVGYIYES